MNEQESIKLIQQTYEFFKRGDIQSLLGLYAEDIDWQLPQMENVPFGGKWRRREGVGAYFSCIDKTQEILQFEPTDFVAQGDSVVVLGHYSWRVKATGREFSSDWVHICTIKDGKVVRFREYLDTAAVSKAHTV